MAEWAARLTDLVRNWVSDGSDVAVTRRMASTTFVLRVANAGIALVSQIVLARWMGEHEFGIYAYVWVWVLLLGGVSGLGLASAAQRFIPEYAESGQMDLLRGFLRNAGLLASMAAGLIALAVAALALSSGAFETWYHVPLLIACASVPAFVLIDFQEGVARAYHMAKTAYVPAYVVQPLLILLVVSLAFLAGFAATAQTLMWVTLGCLVATAAGQYLLMRSRLAKLVPAGPRRSDVPGWLALAWPLLLLDGFYLILTYVDILVLQRFHPPVDVANYYAATKVMAIMSFIVFAVQASTAPRFAQYFVTGEHERLTALMRQAVAWTFIPSLIAAACLLIFGKPLLWLFGPEFVQVYYLLPIIAAGLLARAAVGPVDRLLAMAGEQKLTAWIAGAALLLNLMLNLALIPLLGLAGAALATAIALGVQSAVLFAAARRKFGISLF